MIDFVNMTPSEAHKVVLKIAEVLGVSPDDANHDTVGKAVDALFAAVSGDDKASMDSPEQVNARRQLSAAELAICRDVNCDPAAFLRLKKLRASTTR